MITIFVVCREGDAAADNWFAQLRRSQPHLGGLYFQMIREQKDLHRHLGATINPIVVWVGRPPDDEAVIRQFIKMRSER